MNDWLIISGMVLVTYSVRLSVIALLGERQLPPFASRALRYVPSAALAAIVFPELLMPGGTVMIAPGNLRLVAGIVAAVVAWRTRQTLLSIGVGMVLLWLLQAVG